MELYIHIPFCKQKCRYCDFLSFKDHSPMDAYLKRLNEELKFYGNKYRGQTVETVFIGGGTPSILTEDAIRTLMGTVFREFSIKDGAEITIEANPATFDLPKALTWKKAGINRVSMGVQSFQNELLHILGRIHDQSQAVEGFQTLRKAGFTNISMDLMMGLPQQTLAQWMETLQQAVQLGPEHLSCYSLIIEEGTPFYDAYERDELNLPEEEEERAMYHEAIRYLKDQGYQQYEISNFAQPGHHSRHNVGYWTGVSYIGIGLGASSYIDGIRYHNKEAMTSYLTESWEEVRQTEEVLSREERMNEFMMLGFRMTDGINRETFRLKFGEDPEAVFGVILERLMDQGLIERHDEGYRLTALGTDLGNLVFGEFI